MSKSKKRKKVKELVPSNASSVTIKPHPKEILDLDEETVSIARAKLAGVDFDEIYSKEDRSSSQFLIRIQAKKIRDLFRTPGELKNAFSSAKKKEDAYKDMMIDGIDLDFVKNYCEKKHLGFVSDVEALLIVGFGWLKSGELNV